MSLWRVPKWLRGGGGLLCTRREDRKISQHRGFLMWGLEVFARLSGQREQHAKDPGGTAEPGTLGRVLTLGSWPKRIKAGRAW